MNIDWPRVKMAAEADSPDSFTVYFFCDGFLDPHIARGKVTLWPNGGMLLSLTFTAYPDLEVIARGDKAPYTVKVHPSAAYLQEYGFADRKEKDLEFLRRDIALEERRPLRWTAFETFWLAEHHRFMETALTLAE